MLNAHGNEMLCGLYQPNVTTLFLLLLNEASLFFIREMCFYPISSDLRK